MNPKKQEVVNLLMSAASQYRRGYEAGVADALAVYAPEPEDPAGVAAAPMGKDTLKLVDTKSPQKRKKRKNPWAGLTPEQKAARVAAMRKARGLAPAVTPAPDAPTA